MADRRVARSVSQLQQVTEQMKQLNVFSTPGTAKRLTIIDSASRTNSEPLFAELMDDKLDSLECVVPDRRIQSCRGATHSKKRFSHIAERLDNMTWSPFQRARLAGNLMWTLLAVNLRLRDKI